LPPNQYDLLEIHFACSLNQKGNREIVNLNIDANGVFDGGPLTVTFRSTQTHTLIFQANTFNDDEQDENSKNIMVLGTFIPEGQDIPLDSVYFTTNISYGHTILPQRNLSFVELI
jgi:hypothetical protein